CQRQRTADSLKSRELALHLREAHRAHVQRGLVPFLQAEGVAEFPLRILARFKPAAFAHLVADRLAWRAEVADDLALHEVRRELGTQQAELLAEFGVPGFAAVEGLAR